MTKRLQQYPKQSTLMYLSFVPEHKRCERELIKILSNTFTQRRDIGIEYFEGPIQHIINIVSKYIIDNCSQEQEIHNNFINGKEECNPVNEEQDTINKGDALTQKDSDTIERKHVCESNESCHVEQKGEQEEELAVHEELKQGKHIVQNQPCIISIKNKKEHDDIVITKYYESSKNKFPVNTPIKSIEIYKDFCNWVIETKCRNNISHKKFTAALKEMFGVKSMQNRFSDGIFASIEINDPKKDNSETRILMSFITSGRFTHDNNHYISISSLKQMFDEYIDSISIRVKWSTQFYKIFSEHGYTVREINICKSCEKPSRRGCCVKYSTENRLKRTLVLNMKVID